MKYFRKSGFGKRLLCVALCLAAALSPQGYQDGRGTETEKAHSAVAEEYLYCMQGETLTLPDHGSIISAKDPGGNPVGVSAGGEVMFIITNGVYEIIYPAKTVYVQAYTQNGKPVVTPSFSSVFPAKATAGVPLNLPYATLYSGIARVGNYAYTINISFDGTLLEQRQGGTSETSYTPKSGGLYTFEYVYTTVFREDKSHSFTVEAADREFLITESIPAMAAVGVPLSLKNVRGYYKGAYYSARITIAPPSGEPYSLIGAEFTPSQTGIYFITATAVINGKTFSEILPVEAVYMTASLFTGFNKVTSVQSNTPLPYYSALTNARGVRIEGQTGASFFYGKTVDISNLTQSNDIISLTVDASSATTLSAMRVKLIDPYDENNFVALYWYQNPWNPDMTYVLGEFDYISMGNNNESGDMLPRQQYGTVSFDSSFEGHKALSQKGKRTRPFLFRYNSAEKAVYTNHLAGLTKVLEFDDLLLPKQWKGFSGREAYLKVEFVSGYGAVIIDSVMGRTLDTTQIARPVNDNLLLFEDNAEMASVLHDGAVGYPYGLPVNIPYNRFAGALDVTKKLYMAQGGGSADISGMISGNVFTPAEAGNYKAVYSAADQYGNTVSKEFTFNIKQNPNAITFQSLAEQTADVRGYYTVPAVAAGGGSGKLSSSMYLITDGISRPVSAGEQCFISRAAEIKLRAEAADQIGFTDFREYAVAVNRDIRILDVAGVPRSARAGQAVTFPLMTASDYAFDEGEPGFDMGTVIEANGQRLGTDRIYNVPGAGVQQFTLRYIAGEGTAREMTKDYTVRVIPAGDINVSEYIGRGGSGLVLTDFISGSDFRASGAQTLSLPNPIAADEVMLEFSLRRSGYSYSKITVTLTDFYDSGIALALEFTNVLTVPALTVNNAPSGRAPFFTDGVYNLITGGATHAGVAYRNFSFLYNNAYGQVFSNDGKLIAAPKTLLNGRAFEGFPSGAVFMDINVQSTTGGTSLILNRVANQRFAAGTDGTGPTINLSGALPASAAHNSQITVPAARAYDVLQPQSSVTRTIKAPDGSLLQNAASADAPYTLTLSQYGNYTISYTGTSGGFSYTVNRTVAVNDAVAPSAAFVAPVPQEATIGTALEIPQVSVGDNLDAAPAVYIMMRLPSGIHADVAPGETFVFEEYGVFTLILYARDGAYNITILRYEITVNPVKGE